jgi:ArsR family transcriptional regulator
MICETYIQFFSSLSDATRLEIIKLLRQQEMSVSQLCEESGFEQSRVSHNLRKLKELGFVQSKQDGKKRIYSLEKKTMAPLLNLIDLHVDKYYKHYCKCSGKEKINRWSTRRK